MIALTSPYLWYASRATGLVTLALFSAVVTLGTLVANRAGGRRVGRFELNEIHRSLSLVAMIFLAVHVVTTVVDTYAPTGWISAVVPFASRYDRLGVAIGAVALDLMGAVWLSSLLRGRIRQRSWRFVHWFSWLAFAAALTHTLLIGADTKDGLGLAFLVACTGLVAAAALWRVLGRPPRAKGGTALSPLAASSSKRAP